MKTGDVIFYREEQGIVEKMRGSTAYLRVFREDYDYSDWSRWPIRCGLYSHKTIEVDLVNYYKNKSFWGHLTYIILEFLYDIKEEPGVFFCIVAAIVLILLLLNLGVGILIGFIGTL